MDDVGQNFIIWGDEATEADDARLGGKASGLRRMDAHGLPVPAWFVVTPEAFAASLSPAERNALALAQSGGDEAARAVVATVAVNAQASGQIRDALARLSLNAASDDRFAVRSSALAEDGTGSSWAGQFESYLDVAPNDVPARVADVWRSAFTERVAAYQMSVSPLPSASFPLTPLPPLSQAKEGEAEGSERVVCSEASLSCSPSFACERGGRGVRGKSIPAVLVQRMIRPRASGVAFSADPVTGRRGVALVAAVRGTGEKLVGGDVTGDTFRVGRGGAVLERTLDNDGGDATPAITDDEAQAVAALARRAERAGGRPQDIEWAIDGETGALWLLQSRAVTTLIGVADPDAPRVVWDNSNIAESYNGVTTPLTFSFARNAYEHVYRTFCRLLSVPERRIEASATVFRNMIGLRAGRVYYNLPNWYRALALLPGYQMNRAFMEQMMGVRGSLPDEIIQATAPAEKPPFAERLRDGWDFARSVASLVRSHATLPRQVARFHTRLADALGTDDAAAAEKLAQMRPDELAAHYRELESKLLSRWDAPLVNDFFAMIFHGVLRRVSDKWLSPDQASLHNDLVSGDGGIVSAEPARRVRDMARLLDGMDRPDLVVVLCEAPVHVALRRVRGDAPALSAQFDAYLARFGDRCLEELKLESPTLHDDPTSLVRAVGRLAQSLQTNEAVLAWKRHHAAKGATGQLGQMPDQLGQGLFYLPHPFDVSASGPRQAAEGVLRQSLARKPLRRALYNRILATARYHVRTRENLRFERTRVFGRVRRLCIEMGKRLAAQNRLDDARDVFYLETHEVLGATEGTLTCDDLRGLVAVRRRATEKHRAAPQAPPDRFAEEIGVAGRWSLAPGSEERSDVSPQPSPSPTSNQQPATSNSAVRPGIACCPGVVRGRARVIRDPRGATLDSGDILVAERTDPGWILLFPLAGGVVVERGSLLSHSAIVARELGIPCVVGVAGVMAWLRDGDQIEMDGANGTVRRIEAGEAETTKGVANDASA